MKSKPERAVDGWGTVRCWLNDKLYREDEPAFEWVGRGKSWYLNGEEVSEEDVRNNPSSTRFESPELPSISRLLREMR